MTNQANAAFPSSRALCASCDVSADGGVCPNCGTYWWRNEEGKLIGATLTFQPPMPTAVPDFWRNSGTLREAVELAPSMDQRLAEAVVALNTLWNVLTIGGLLSDQQSAAVIYTHTRREVTSRQLAEALGISHAGASNVLNYLVDKRLLVRRRDGRRHFYQLAILWPMGSAAKAAQLVTRRLAS